MPRPKGRRSICMRASDVIFKPAGINIKNLKTQVLLHEELEALRLKDFLGVEQKEAANKMKISQSTFHRILIEARRKVAGALINSTMIKIEGGNNLSMENKDIKNLKIAISASSKDINGDIDDRLGRCPYFIVVTLKNGEISKEESFENMNKDMRGGAGTAVAKMLADLNADVIITESVGPRAMEVLNQFNISVFQASGSIKEAIEKMLNQNS